MEPLLPSWTVNLEGLSALVWHTFSIQLAWNSEQNYTKPITMRMVVKNQSHVSWRSVPRHFIRSLKVGFHSCPFKQWEFIDHVGSAEKQRVLTQICNAEEHLSLGHCTAYTLRFVSFKKPRCIGRFNKVNRHTWEPACWAIIQYKWGFMSDCFEHEILQFCKFYKGESKQKAKQKKLRLSLNYINMH